MSNNFIMLSYLSNSLAVYSFLLKFFQVFENTTLVFHPVKNLMFYWFFTFVCDLLFLSGRLRISKREISKNIKISGIESYLSLILIFYMPFLFKILFLLAENSSLFFSYFIFFIFIHLSFFSSCFLNNFYFCPLYILAFLPLPFFLLEDYYIWSSSLLICPSAISLLLLISSIMLV